MNLFQYLRQRRERKLRERCLRYSMRVNQNRPDSYKVIWYADRCYDFITKGKIITSLYDWESIRES